MSARRRSLRWRATAAGGVAAGLVALSAAAAGAGTPFFGAHNTITSISTTVPANGDINPYGMAVVPDSVGLLHKGDVLISNFNNSSNQQGTGITIDELPPGGIGNAAAAPLFATVHLGGEDERCPGGIGLTTALAVFPSGWVVVGSLPTSNGMSATAKAGCLIVLNAWGRVVRTIHGGLINGPWDMTATQQGDDGVLFVTNVLNGITAADNVNNTTVDEGTVVRVVLDLSRERPRLESETVIASGFPEHTDPSALVIGPTGVGLSADNSTLYVNDTVDNRITKVPDPLGLAGPVFGTGTTVTSGGSLNGPLGMAIAPNGDILTVNSIDGNAVETTPGGSQVKVLALDTSPQPPPALAGAGTLFGLALAPNGTGLYFVDDGTNTFNVVS
jgi:hypothetical protein